MNRNSVPNDDDQNEQEQAACTAELLETCPPSASPDRQAIHELGQLLREAALTDLPPSSDTIRQSLLAALDLDAAELGAVERPATSVSHRRRRRWWLAIVTSALFVLGMVGYRLSWPTSSSESPVVGLFGVDGKSNRESVELEKSLSPAADPKPQESPASQRSEISESNDRTVAEVDESDKTVSPQSSPDRTGSATRELQQRPAEFVSGGEFPFESPRSSQAGQANQSGQSSQGQPARTAGVSDRTLGFSGGQSDSSRPLAGEGLKDEELQRSSKYRSLGPVTGRVLNLAGKLGGEDLGGGGFGSVNGRFVLGGGRSHEGKDDSDQFNWSGSAPALGRFSRRDKDLSLGFDDGRRLPGQEQYLPIVDNAFVPANGPAAISTFSIDVDTASYTNMRRFLTSGQRPPRDSVRIEELVNYFQYDYAQPTGPHPFSVATELADCPWQTGHQLLRIGLQGQDIDVQERPANNVVFLIDVSGSMNADDKLPLLKSGFQMLARQLGENDRVSIVTYAGQAGVALSPTNGSQTQTITNAIEKLTPGGSTHGSAGIELAYQLAQQNFIHDGVNKVVLATDGDLNVGVTDDQELVKLIGQKAAEGVFLTVLGFGTGNLKDGKLEQLADRGNGVYAYIDSTREARRVLVDQLSATLVTIAKDVKIQIEFNPAEVKSYRLLGYENRVLATKDFDDDRKDAGEIGAGHCVTAIYQIEPVTQAGTDPQIPPGMKYQAAQQSPAPTERQLSAAAQSGEIATIALRYKQPAASTSQRLEVIASSKSQAFSQASDDFRFAASVAGFGMLLRESKHQGAINSEDLIRTAQGALGKDQSGVRAEFVDLIRRFQANR